jgi:hypothetical protein
MKHGASTLSAIENNMPVMTLGKSKNFKKILLIFYQAPHVCSDNACQLADKPIVGVDKRGPGERRFLRTPK